MPQVSQHADVPSDRINVGQGSFHVTDHPAKLLTTVLGSCVACCLFDPVCRVGGMNHFLLPEPRGGARCEGGEAERYGLFAMELLVNEMLKAGASRRRLRAHLYGGANMLSGMQPIGTANAAFARHFLEQDGISLIHWDLGGRLARRIDFKAAVGQARCRTVEAPPTIERQPPPIVAHGDLELF